MRSPLSDRLPTFPWNTLEAARAQAAKHPEGLIDLSVGTPVDDIAPGINLALAEAGQVPGYPPTTGTVELHEAIAAWLNRRYGCAVLAKEAMAVVGTKEAIALLPTLLGIHDSTVVIPPVAYPTYEVAALTSANTPVFSDEVIAGAELMFINSPSNPTGAVHDVEYLRALVARAREHGVIVASDECYIGLGWDKEPVSILDERVCGGDHSGLIAMHSLSKSSNMASYRAGFFVGDAALIAELTEARKHLGLMVPGPVQSAMLAALKDDDQEKIQKLRYAKRRAVLLKAFVEAGFRIEHSHAGLYLWATRGEDGRATVEWLAERGILVAPGEFYGQSQFIRIALTASDDHVAEVANRLAS